MHDRDDCIGRSSARQLSVVRGFVVVVWTGHIRSTRPHLVSGHDRKSSGFQGRTTVDAFVTLEMYLRSHRKHGK
jgi:hypothetical protein